MRKNLRLDERLRWAKERKMKEGQDSKSPRDPQRSRPHSQDIETSASRIGSLHSIKHNSLPSLPSPSLISSCEVSKPTFGPENHCVPKQHIVRRRRSRDSSRRVGLQATKVAHQAAFRGRGHFRGGLREGGVWFSNWTTNAHLSLKDPGKISLSSPLPPADQMWTPPKPLRIQF